MFGLFWEKEMSKKWKTLLVMLLVAFCITACRGVAEQPMTGTQDTDETVSSSDTMQETETEIETEIETETETETIDSEQAEKERLIVQMQLYRAIADRLSRHEYGDRIAVSAESYDLIYGSFGCVYENNEALKYAYHKLIELEEIDPLLNEVEWLKYVPEGSMPDFDRKGFLEKFYIVENVPIKIMCETTYDGADYRKDADWVTFHYNPDGTLCYIDNGVDSLDEYRLHRKANSHDVYYCYENDKIVKLLLRKYAGKSTHWVREYDKAGRLKTEYIAGNPIPDRIDYTYNKDGQLIESVMYCQMDSIEDMYPELSQGYFTYYTYDEKGLLIKKEEKHMQCTIDGKPRYCHYDNVWEYTYDDSGKVVSAVLTGRAYLETDSEQNLVKLSSLSNSNITYTYDDAGRLATKTTVDMPREEYDIPGYVGQKRVQVETYIYGDYYSYGQCDINIGE